MRLGEREFVVMSSFPTSVWDGDSGSRDSDTYVSRAPDARDWQRIIAEVAAVQSRVLDDEAGVDDDTLDSVGTVAVVTGLSAVEKGNGSIHKTILTLDEVDVATTDGSTPATDGAWGTKTLYTFPVGRLVILSAHAVFPLGGLVATTGGGTGLSDTADLGIGVGTVAAAQATEFGLSGTAENIAAEMDVNLVAGASDAVETATNVTAAAHDGTSSAISAKLNLRTLGDDDHGVTADILVVSGTITILWTMIGDE